MVRKAFLMVIGLSLILTLTVAAEDPGSGGNPLGEVAKNPEIPDPGIPDTIRFESIQVPLGTEEVFLEVYMYNDEELGALTLPFKWDSDDVTCDSIIYTGGRIDYLDVLSYQIDNDNKRANPGGLPLFVPYVEPGSGLVFTIQLSLDPAATDQVIMFDSTFFPPAAYFELTTSDAFNFTPQIVPGTLTVGNPVAAPEIAVSPESFTFSGTAGEPILTSQTLTIDNIGGDTLAWTVTKATDWLNLSPTTGTDGETVTVSVDITGLPSGDHKDTIVVTDPNASNSPVKVPVLLTLAEPPPTISVDPASFEYTEVIGANPSISTSIDISNSGGGTLNWSLTKTETWLTLDASSGSGDATVGITVDLTGLTTAADYKDTIVVADAAATNSPVKVPVTITMVEPPCLALSATEFSFAGDPDELLSQELTVSNCGQADLSWTATGVDASWLSVDPLSSDVVPTTVTLAANLTGLTPGDYSDTLTFSGADPLTVNSPQDVVVNLTVTNPAIPDGDTLYVADVSAIAGNQVAVDLALANTKKISAFSVPLYYLGTNIACDSLSFVGGVAEGMDQLLSDCDPDAQTFGFSGLRLTEDGFNIEPGRGHLATLFFSIDSTAAAQVVPLDTSSGVGMFSYSFVDSNGGSIAMEFEAGSITVEPLPCLALEPDTLDYVYYLNGSTQPSKTTTIQNCDGAVLEWAAPDNLPSWVSFDPTSGTIDPGMSTELTVTITGDGLTEEGNYDALIDIADNAPNTPPLYIFVSAEIIPPPEETNIVTVGAGVFNPLDLIEVPVSLYNESMVSDLILPLKFGGTLICDSVSFVGTRLSPIATKSATIDNTEQTILIEATPGTTLPLVDGDGAIAKLYFSVMGPSPPQTVEVDTTVISGSTELLFADETGAPFVPEFYKGILQIEEMPTLVCGDIFDEGGEPISGAIVQLWVSYPEGELVGVDTTGADGKYCFDPNLIVGRRYLNKVDMFVRADGYVPQVVLFVSLGVDITLEDAAPVQPTYEWVNFYCYLSTIEGTPLPVGTVIDAYDEDSVRCGTFVVETEGQYGLMPVYRDDPNTPDIDEGADPDDTLTFRVNNLPTTPDVTPIWTQLGDNQQVCLEAGLFRIDIITLQPDWNLISWKVNSENDTLSFLFSDILGCLDVALGFEKVGLTFDPDLPEFSTLKTGDHLHGYWLRMECPDTLAVQGAQIAVDTPIPMNVGWNLISYLKTDTDSLTHAFADILDKVQVVLGFNGEAKSWYPELADISTLQLLETGHGYWVWLVAPDTLHYPLTSVYPGGVVRDDAGSKFASTRVTATPEWVNIYSRQLTLDGYAVADNSEIVAVDGSDRIVGAGVVQNGVLKITPVYRDDPRTPFSDGVVAGETFRLVVGGVYTNESFTWSDAGDVIPVDHLTTAEKQPNGLPAQYALYPTYPNPFNPSTTIAFDLPEGGHTQIAIYNILGEKVAVLVDRFLEAGAHEVIWNGTDATGRMQASGIYLVRMKSGSFTQARKMTLLK